MKKILAPVLFLWFIVGCESESQLTFEPLLLNGETCATCPSIEINVPNAIDGSSVATAINRSLSEEIISLLSFSEGQGDIDTAEKAIASFTNSYKELKSKFPDEMAWEAKINGDVIYEDANMVTVSVNSYSYTGGAHGYASTSFLNFDKKRGVELDTPDLFDDIEGFEKLAEAQFRTQEKVPEDKNINATGFMFEGDAFHLPYNMGYTPDGIQLIYNQYEVASYADGPIVLTLPYVEANKYLKLKVEP
ncbi:DUF3298/DUF4163 domain-containing protein [Flagellimonas taeanensis]|uniref:DUF3298 and DUF4163 domain-containing protein n=1 Tax=Flavobacteriaceae TaxID=49546 RepID=UPI000E68380F|nr:MULTISPECIES: DUF3298 and DUF4163 domain-containing protein [Allomuricauda]MDC6385230.1 DUF4163 domain-containing protein [Muricauda sp. SK9]RIV52692.1 DUF3298/DUF4163 domain-containing protein [Allomuricauda taeanensis]